MKKQWGGRFEGQLDPVFERFNQSLGFDRRLLEADVRGSVAWARELGAAGVLKAAEVERLVAGLEAIGRETAADPSRLDGSTAEDVHSFVESALYEKVGELAGRLHTGRSRNDQVATDLKLWARDAFGRVRSRVEDLVAALVTLADEHADAPLPGYTHLQRAQPITIGHHLLAYVEMLARDRGRLKDALARMDTCPLGAAALAGTAFGVDRPTLAERLGFKGGPAGNSLDAVASRDHACELVFCCTQIAIHLSRLAEDWIFFSTHEAGFLRFDDTVSTGSSLMPQKKNPDVMELVRGKAGRVIGDLQSLLVMLKGLPLAYNKDMQEDKEPLFDAFDTTLACLEVAAIAARGARFDRERCAAAAGEGYLNATDLADLLVSEGVPFRDAHERTGVAVRRALELGVELQDLPAATLAELFPELDGDLASLLSVEKVLSRRCVGGGTSPDRVRASVRAWKKRMAAWGM